MSYYESWQEGVRNLLKEGMLAMMPDRPNVKLIRKTGGTLNKYDEWENQNIKTWEFRAVVIPITKSISTSPAGFQESANAEMVWGENSLEVRITKGDHVQILNDKYRVLSITPFYLNNITEYYSAQLYLLNEEKDV